MFDVDFSDAAVPGCSARGRVGATEVYMHC